MASGFLCSGEGSVSGNYGLMDQIAALKWVQQYISCFGGDPNNVTIFGESAGGMSVSFLLTIEETKGLFKRAISQSGVASSPGFCLTKEKAARILKKMLPSIGCHHENPKEIISFLKSQPAENLVQNLGDNWRPVIDDNLIKKHPTDLYRSGHFHKVDYMLGCNSHEGALFVMLMAHSLKVKNVDQGKTVIDNTLRMLLGSSNDHRKVVDHFKKRYFPSSIEGDSREITKSTVDFLSDFFFLGPSDEIGRLHAASSKTYMYHYKYRPSMSPYPAWAKADHAMDILSVFGVPFLPGLDFLDFSEEDKAASKLTMQYWTNFAKTGDPNGHGMNVHWEPLDESGLNCLVLQENPTMQTHPAAERIRFFREFYNSVRNSAKNEIKAKY